MKVLLVDDHALIRDAVRSVVRQLQSDAAVLEAANAAEARRLIDSNPDLDLVLLDLTLPDDDGFLMLAELRERHPMISVVVLSAHEDRDSVVKALDLGALGFIPKSAAREVMLSALALVFSGGVYIPTQALNRGPASPPAPGAQQTPGAQQPPAAQPGAAQATPAELGLTPRQLDVLALMTRGKSNKAICRALDLAEPTVKAHVSAILRVLNVGNRTEAVIAVGGLGWRLPLLAKP